MNEDNENGIATNSTSEETAQEEVESTVVAEEETKSEDIDFNKEAEELEKKPTHSALEKAQRSLHFNAQKVKELGGDPEEILGIKKEVPVEKTEQNFVTKDDLAEAEARKLAKSDAELKVIMWHYRNGIQRTGNIYEDIENAHFLAHKPRLKTVFSEMRRAKDNVPPQGDGESAGQKEKVVKTPELPRTQAQILQRRGYKMVKPGLWQGKFNQTRWDEASKSWVEEKISN